jgi:hypothetical protein
MTYYKTINKIITIKSCFMIKSSNNSKKAKKMKIEKKKNLSINEVLYI